MDQNSDARRTVNLRMSYDRVAGEYARRLYNELDGKPFDRELLDRFAAELKGRGVVCDMGCGPGHVARYLAGRGVDAIGVDLSAGMVAQAVALNPGIPFYQGDMTALDFPDEVWAGIAAFYSIIHIPRHQVAATLTEMKRVLRPGGLMLLAFHIGREELRETELWGYETALDYWFFEPAEMTGYLKQAGFQVDEILEREPYAPEIEYQSRRAYLLAKKPAR